MAPTIERGDIQGILASGYGRLRQARFTLFAAADPAGAGDLLRWLLPRVTTADAGPRDSDRRAGHPQDTAWQIALTATGLRRLGLPRAALDGFSAEFVAGMADPDRSRFLGDLDDSDPRHWAWGGPGSPEIDGIILAYAADPPALAAMRADLRQAFDRLRIRTVADLPTLELTGNEQFGFRDGISQPLVEGLSPPRDGELTVPAGEFVLGYPNAYDLLTDRPLLPADADPGHLLPPDAGRSGAADLGRNGSYLVVRQLAQDVDGFWRYAQEATRRPDGSADPQASVALAAKMVGRWPSGAPLARTPDRDDPQLAGDNSFGYDHTDPTGYACPLGAHVRRVNPRDSLDPRPGTVASLRVNDRHRLLRRGRSYGPAYSDGVADPGAAGSPGSSDNPDSASTPDGAAGSGGTGNPGDAVNPGDAATAGGERGLYFLCLAGNLSRQFEFVQHSWVNNPTFHGLYRDTDPIVGRRSPDSSDFTVPARPVRRHYREVPQFVRVRGGGYFFLPGISALRYLARLAAADQPAAATAARGRSPNAAGPTTQP